MPIVLIVLLAILALVHVYADRNLHGDDRMMKKVVKAGFAEKQVTAESGAVLNYGEGGPKEAQPLLLIHGQGQAWQDYDAVLPALSKRFHVFAVDCHGHGKSSHDASRYNCDKMTDDFVWFIKNVIGAPCVISGHSSGGVLAAATAAKSPENAAALVIEDAPFFCVRPEEMKERNAIVWHDGFELMDEFQKQGSGESYNVYSLRHAILWSLFGGLKDKLAESALKYEKKHPGEPLKIWYVPQSMLRGMYYSNSYDMRFGLTFFDGTWFDGVSQEEILRGVKCPCTYLKAKTGYIIGGKPQTELDGVDTSGAVLCCANTEADAERVTQLVSNCRRVTAKTNDHLIHAKYPELFVSELERFAK